MKKLILLTATLSALAAVSCRKAPAQEPEGVPSSPARITVCIRGEGTRATGQVKDSPSGDARVNSLQVFVFRGDELEDCKDAGASMEATLAATAGERTIFALVNAPSITGVPTLSALKAAATRLADNAADSFVMTGETTCELADGATVPVTVRRIVSRVSLGKVSTAFRYMREGWKVNLNGIYLINVSAENTYGLTASPASSPASAWANRLSHSDSALDPLLCDPLTAVTVSNGHPYVREHVFYPYPNDVSEGDCLAASGLPAGSPMPAAWCPRPTLLVLDVTLVGEQGGTPFSTRGYYPVALPALERNRTYVIEEIQITREPSPVPYDPIVVGEAGISVTVHPWEVGLSLGTVVI